MTYNLILDQLDTALAHVSKRPVSFNSINYKFFDSFLTIFFVFQISDSLDDGELKKEIGKRDVLIAQLLSQSNFSYFSQFISQNFN